jgi:hypothetical protein
VVWVTALGEARASHCGQAAGDDAAKATVRTSIALHCPCAGGSRSAFLRCAKGEIEQAVAHGPLPAYCASTVKRCVTRSTCGRPPGWVTCCRTNATGRTTCSVKSSAAKCAAPSSGSTCTTGFSSCCDACTASGCAPTYTPTITPTPTITLTPSITPTATNTPTIPAICQPVVGVPPVAQVPLTVLMGSSQCGGTALHNPSPAPPLSGAVTDGSGAALGDLALGCLYASSLPGLTLPDGASAKLAVTGSNLLSITLGGSAGTGPHDCTLGAGPGSTCANGQPGIDGMGTCGSDADCADGPTACTPTANCYFGPPIPVPNGPLSACVISAFLSDLCGRVDLLPPAATFATALSSRVYFTGNADSPCPRCESGVCNGGDRAGLACAPVGSAQTSIDCPPPANRFLAALTVVIPDLTTGTSTLSAPGGLLCDGQPMPGAFGLADARTISETGTAPGGSSNLLAVNLAGTFCVPPTGTFLDLIAQLPGAGAITAPGQINLNGLLP